MKRILFLGLLLWSLLHGTDASAQLLSDSRNVSYPAFGMWNGHNNHVDILECSNYSADAITVGLTLYRRTGLSLGSTSLLVKPQDSVNFVLNNSFAITNDYGMYRLDASIPSSAQSGLRCATVIYRFAPAGSSVAVTYSFTLPVISPVTGITTGLYNSLNPLSTVAPAVENYVTIANPGSSPFSAGIELYDGDGAFISTIPITNLGANQRADVSVVPPNAKIIGMYKVVPGNASQPYFAFLSAYARGNSDFVYAYSLGAAKGSCNGEPVFASTFGPALNWVQFANPTASQVNYTFRVGNSNGTEVHTDPRTLAPHAHEHLLVNPYIGDNATGTVRGTCTSGELLTQGATYGRTGPGGAIAWGYANQARGLNAGDGELSVHQLNTFLGVYNWLRVTSPTAGGTAFVAQAQTSQTDAHQTASFAPFTGSTDVPIYGLAAPDQNGNLAASLATQGRSLSSESLRVFVRPNGTIGYVNLVPPAIVNGNIPDISLVQLASGLSTPVGLANAADGSNRMFIIEQAGKIKILSGGSVLPTPFLDITAKVLNSGEQGMLGLAFHPNFATSKKFYVYYIAKNGNSIVAEYGMTTNPNLANAASERILISQPQPYANHKAGQLNFGPDGYLYIAFGDGGSGGDPQNHAQNRGDILGDILRIDVNGTTGPLPYVIPPDNPFVGQPGLRTDIWAYGFRNPYRFSFDRLNGRLFAGDVGQSAMEEVDIVTKGGNYGWHIMEGTLCYNPSTNCPTAGLTPPIFGYGRSDGYSVIGGYVYRGNSTSLLFGKYVYGDYGSKKIWTLEQQNNGSWVRNELLQVDFSISSFGEDEAGELYVVDLGGKVYRISLL